MFVLGLVGLLLFGKDLPLMVRKAATEYFRYKKLITEATVDIRRELDTAATHLENEKRKLEEEVHKTMPRLDDHTDPVESASNNSYDTPADQMTYGDGDLPAQAHQNTIEAPYKPVADPLALDVPSPSSLSHRGTDAVKSPAAQVAALDTYQKGVPPPSKIPPPL